MKEIMQEIESIEENVSFKEAQRYILGRAQGGGNPQL